MSCGSIGEDGEPNHKASSEGYVGAVIGQPFFEVRCFHSKGICGDCQFVSCSSRLCQFAGAMV